MGKFGISSLRKAEDLISMFYKTTSQVQELREFIKISPPSTELLYHIDEISNICSIMADTSQAISELFPSESWKQAAYSVQDSMHEVFASLNQDTSIQSSLITLKNSYHWTNLTPSQQLFVENMLRDLEKEGIDHKTPTALSILRLQSTFLYNIHTSKIAIPVDFNELESIPTSFRPIRPGSVYNSTTPIPLSKPELVSSLNYCSSPSLRSKLFDGVSTICKENLPVLKDLLSARQDFSKGLGFANYSAYALNYQSFRIDPETLIEKLCKCHEYLSPKLNNEYSILLDKKALQEQESRQNPVSLLPSDIPYYIQKHLDSQLADKFPEYSPYHSIKNYFTIYNILQGVTSLLNTLFNLTSDIKIVSGEETWSNDIIKLSLFRKGNAVGYLYLDLFTRPGKRISTAAKFNIYCGKRKSMSSAEMQLPIVVLSCSFNKVESLSSSLYISLDDLKAQGVSYNMVQEFYHELGHAMHSLLSLNDFQSYSGTRVALDLAEIPSHVFENFMSDYDFIKTWARHNQSGAVLPYELYSHYQTQSEQFLGFSHHIQLSIAVFDILMHTHPSLSSALEYFQQHFKCPELQNEWYCSVEHFVEYASCYYSYILDKSLSHVIWDTVFQRQSLNAKAGELLEKSLLSQGGNIHPQSQLDNLLSPFLILDQNSTESKIDPFYVMEYWYKNTFNSTQLIPIEEVIYKHKLIPRKL
jgi:mitochondrial intermediate peptidase